VEVEIEEYDDEGYSANRFMATFKLLQNTYGGEGSTIEKAVVDLGKTLLINQEQCEIALKELKTLNELISAQK